MTSVGERLRHEREIRHTTIEQIAEATGIGVAYLEAMESGAYDALPGRAFGKLYVRAYAEVLEFDPQPLIDEYDREQRLRDGPSTTAARPEPAGARPVAAAIARWRESKAVSREVPEPAVEAVVEQLVEPAVEPDPVAPELPIPQPAVPAHRSNRRSAAVLLAAVALATAAYLGTRKSPDVPSPPQRSDVPPPTEATPELPPQGPAPVPAPPTAAAIQVGPAHPPAPGALTVREFGMGRRIVASRIDGEGSRFTEGEVAWFQTRVLGGNPGETVRHVWIYDGRAQQSIALRLGGPDWRTHSTKTLYRSGPWTVEARDRAGRVLATASFTCVPRGRSEP